MTKITLNTLTLRNFKGCADLTLHLDGRSASIYGDNAAGKTTIYDALTWLLFGKDSSGVSKFNIKPLAPSGEVLDHAATTSVKADFAVNGQPVTLERTYFELWSKKRGRSESTFDGHSSEFFYNGLPVQKNEFSERVKMLCDESTFRILTDIRWFCFGESEANRRSVLFDLIGGVSDDDVLATSRDFAPLAAARNGLTVDDLRTSLMTQRRKLSNTTKTIPARIDEQKRTIEEYDSVNYDHIRDSRAALAVQQEEAQRTLSALRSEDSTVALTAQRDSAQAKLDALEAKNTAHRSVQLDPNREGVLEREKKTLTARINNMETDDTADYKEIDRLTAFIEDCRMEWSKNNSAIKRIACEVFTPGVCPNCGQALPANQVEVHRKKWDDDRIRRMDDTKNLRDHSAENAKAAKDRIAQLEERIRRREEEREELNARLDTIGGELEELHAAVVTDLPDYRKNKAELTHTIVELEEQIGKIRQDSGSAIAVARKNFIDLSGQINNLDGILAGESVLKTAKARVEELEATRKKTAEETERLDALLDLCDRFTRAKAEYIDDNVNGLFSRVRWQLFEEQVNGGLKDCCKATVDGVPYADLNTGAQINAGLDVIATLSSARDIAVPLFVDNAESVTHLAGLATQVIRLVVSAGDEVLRVEME